MLRCDRLRPSEVAWQSFMLGAVQDGVRPLRLGCIVKSSNTRMVFWQAAHCEVVRIFRSFSKFKVLEILNLHMEQIGPLDMFEQKIFASDLQIRFFELFDEKSLVRIFHIMAQCYIREKMATENVFRQTKAFLHCWEVLMNRAQCGCSYALEACTST